MNIYDTGFQGPHYSLYPQSSYVSAHCRTHEWQRSGQMSSCILTLRTVFHQPVSQMHKFMVAEASSREVRGVISATHDYKCTPFKMYGVGGDHMP